MRDEVISISNPNINSPMLGNRIQMCRTAKKLTQQEMSELLDISVHYLSDIERGSRVPKLDTLVKILNELGVSADFVLQESLVVGYKEQSGEIQKLISKLPQKDRETVFRYVRILIESLL